MQPPSSSSYPQPASPAPSRRPPPQPEFQCHHADCLRRFVRKTSLTNHLKAHQNIRSRSIYRTKRARLRAAAAMQAAADAAAVSPSATPSPARALPPHQHQHLQHHLQQQNQQPHPPYRTPAAIPPHPTRRDSSISRRTDSSPISTASGPSSPTPHHVLTAHTTATASSVHDPPAPQDAPTSLVSPNSFSTHPLDAPDNPALLFTKAFDMSAVAAAPTWGINTHHTPHDNYHPGMLPVPFPHHHHRHDDNGTKNDQQQQHVPNVSPPESLPIVTHVEAVPNAASAATAAAASDLLPQTDLFSEQIEALHPYEFLGDFGSYS